MKYKHMGAICHVTLELASLSALSIMKGE